LLVAGLSANLAFPIAFILVVTWGMRPWHNPDEVQNILVGLALVAAMPIAGSSTAWSQNTDGDLALSLGLVLGSTLLSPVMTPLALHAVGWMASGDYASVLHGLASGGTGAFLAIGVIVPSFLGIGLRLAAGPARIEAAKPVLKLVNTLILLALNYANAAVSLPQAIAQPDLDFLAVTLGLVAGLCILAFAAGWTAAWLLGAGRDQRVSLMFALGMNNNGTGLVLASMALAGYPRVMLPIIFYNMIQHLVAGAANALVDRPARPPGAARPLPGRTRKPPAHRAPVQGMGGRTRTSGCPGIAIEPA
jgi:BASS family bile acid:Na+ symporter